MGIDLESHAFVDYRAKNMVELVAKPIVSHNRVGVRGFAHYISQMSYAVEVVGRAKRVNHAIQIVVVALLHRQIVVIALGVAVLAVYQVYGIDSHIELVRRKIAGVIVLYVLCPTAFYTYCELNFAFV